MEKMGQKEEGGREWRNMLNSQYKHVRNVLIEGWAMCSPPLPSTLSMEL